MKTPLNGTPIPPAPSPAEITAMRIDRAIANLAAEIGGAALTADQRRKLQAITQDA